MGSKHYEDPVRVTEPQHEQPGKESMYGIEPKEGSIYKEEDTIRLRHYRLWVKADGRYIVHPRGGVTLAYRENIDSTITVASACCSFRDNYRKRLGAAIASGRLLRGPNFDLFVNQDNVSQRLLRYAADLLLDTWLRSAKSFLTRLRAETLAPVIVAQKLSNARRQPEAQAQILEKDIIEL